MHSLIIGGGKIGYYLTKVLIEKDTMYPLLKRKRTPARSLQTTLT